MIRTHLIIVLCSVFVPLALLLICAFARFRFVRPRSSSSTGRTSLLDRLNRRGRFGKRDRKSKVRDRVVPVDQAHEDALKEWATFGSTDSHSRRQDAIGDADEYDDTRSTNDREASLVFSRYGVTPVATVAQDGTRSYLHGMFALDGPSGGSAGTRDEEARLYKSETRHSGRSHFSTASRNSTRWRSVRDEEEQQEMQERRAQGETDEFGVVSTRRRKTSPRPDDDDAWNESSEDEKEGRASPRKG